MPSEEMMRDMRELEEALEHFNAAPPHKFQKELDLSTLNTGRPDTVEPYEIEYFFRQVIEQAHELRDRAVQLKERLQPILRQDEQAGPQETGSIPQKPTTTQLGSELATLLSLLQSTTDTIKETERRCEL